MQSATPLSKDSWSNLHAIRQWFDTELGLHVLDTEAALLDQLLPAMFGYHLAQFSVQERPLFSSSNIRNKFCFSLDSSSQNKVIASPVNLPLSDDSIDVMLIHHLLDFSDSIQEILREVSRVVMPMGHVVLMGFNPISMWGFWKAIARHSGHAPWNGRFSRPGLLMDYLNLLDFKIDRAQYAIYGPPVARWSRRVNDYSMGVSRRLNLPIGSVYLIVAQKHVASMRAVKPIWNNRRPLGRLTAVQSVRHY